MYKSILRVFYLPVSRCNTVVPLKYGSPKKTLLQVFFFSKWTTLASVSFILTQVLLSLKKKKNKSNFLCNTVTNAVQIMDKPLTVFWLQFLKLLYILQQN